MSGIMKMTRKLFPDKSQVHRNAHHAGTAASVVIKMPDDHPDWLEAVIQDVRNWEVPDIDQLDHAFDGFLEAQSAPIEEIDRQQLERILRGRELVQRLLEIAPDLFEKALQRYPLDTGYYLDGGAK